MDEINIKLYLNKYCRILDCCGNLYIGQIGTEVFQTKNEDAELEDTININYDGTCKQIFVDDIFLIELYEKSK